MLRSDDQTLIAMEKQVLSFLCQPSGEGDFHRWARVALGPYRWREALHQVIFQILGDLPADSLTLIREQLPARLTRHGFPDVAWEGYFEPPGVTEADVERMVPHLLDSG